MNAAYHLRKLAAHLAGLACALGVLTGCHLHVHLPMVEIRPKFEATARPATDAPGEYIDLDEVLERIADISSPNRAESDKE